MCGCSGGGSWGAGGMHGCSWGGMCGCSGGCVVAPGGHAWLLWGACMVAPRGACMVAPGEHAWLLLGGMHGCSGGGHVWDTTRYGDRINERAVRILLECILVLNLKLKKKHIVGSSSLEYSFKIKDYLRTIRERVWT